jgi:two-component system chemotaxis response regulator CheY
MSGYACLVVEDSSMMRQLIVFALSRIKNMTVTEADDGIAGLNGRPQAREENPLR